MGDYLLAISKTAALNKGGVEIGDIVAVVDAKHKFTELEKLQFLIVPITGVDETKIAKLMVPLYDDGSDGPVIDGERSTNPKITGKRKYKIFTSDLATISSAADIAFDSEKAEDTSQNYQPLTDAQAKIAITQTSTIYNKFSKLYVTDFASATVPSGDTD